MQRRTTLRLVFTSLFILFATTVGRASTTVDRGWELFQTITPGTTFAGAPFVGVPLGSFDFTTGSGGDFGRGLGTLPVGSTDTIVKRTLVANAPSTLISTELVALQLRSVDPVDFGLGLDFYYMTLQSIRGGPVSTGNMTVNFGPEPVGPPPIQPVHGTFSSFFDVFFDIRKGSLSGPISQSNSLPLTASGFSWSHFPPAGATEIDAATRFFAGAGNRSQDFYPIGPITQTFPTGATITTVIAPEPGAAMLLLIAGACRLMHRRRR